MWDTSKIKPDILNFYWDFISVTTHFQSNKHSKIRVSGAGKQTTQCCGYGVDAADNVDGFDCALIPGATKAAVDANGNAQTLKGAGNGFCGGELATADTSADAATVCCKYIQLNRIIL